MTSSTFWRRRIRGAFALIGWLVLSSGSLQAEIYTYYSDVGTPAAVNGSPPVIAYSGCGANNGHASFLGSSTDLNPPEGYDSFKSANADTNGTCGFTYFGWGLQYAGGQDLSRFKNGELRFWIYASTGNITVDIKDAVKPIQNIVFHVPLNSYIGNKYNQWISIRIPFPANLSGTGLSNVLNPFLITANISPATFYVDNVRYVDSSVEPIFNVSLKNRSNDAAATQITWNQSVPHLPVPGGWAAADQYIQYEVDSDTTTWGVQIYTDNTATDANPRFTTRAAPGTIGSNPAGLVDASSPSITLPMAWRTVDLTTATLAAFEPNACPGTGSACLWQYLQDFATPTISSQSTQAFLNGDPSVTLKDHTGIHYAQGIGISTSTFGGANPPDVVYLEANFGQAVTPRTYQTSTVRLEYYTQ